MKEKVEAIITKEQMREEREEVSRESVESYRGVKPSGKPRTER